jgi:hypothetical protein
MCDLAIAMTLAASVIGGVGQIQQAQAQASAAEYNAKIGDMNAELAERRAKDAIERGTKEEQRKRQEVAQIKAKQQAAMAANGVDISFGSPLDTLVDTAVMGELDALTIRSNTYRESYDHRVDAVNKRSQANLSRMEADAAKTGGYIAALGTVVGGVGDAYGSYKKSRIGVIG